MSKQPSKRTVFIVDDNSTIALTLGMILCREGYNSLSFNEPIEALQAASGDSPDLLITDIIMPAMTGIELASQIQHLTPNCKILLFSGPGSQFDLVEKAEHDGQHFALLTKPAHPNVLLQKVEEVLNSRSLTI